MTVNITQINIKTPLYSKRFSTLNIFLANTFSFNKNKYIFIDCIYGLLLIISLDSLTSPTILVAGRCLIFY